MITTPNPAKVVTAAVVAGVTWYAARWLGETIDRMIAEDNEVLDDYDPLGHGLRRTRDTYVDLALMLPPALHDRLVLARQVVFLRPIAYKLVLTPHGIETGRMEPRAAFLSNLFHHVGVQAGVGVGG